MNAYIVIRVPKCGSTSLARMITKSLPDSNVFYISSAGIELANEENENISPFEKFRIYKNSTRSIWKKHRCLSFDAVWEKTNRRIKDGDIIHGHLTVDAIKLEDFNKKLISVIRDPYDRMLSEYNYTRRAYNNKNFISKNYKNKLYAAGNYSFEGYISYLKENQPLHARYMSRFLIGKKKHTNPIEFVKDNYFALGILERMDLFIEDFYKKSNIRLNQYKTNITKSKEHIDLSANERKAVKDFCDEDIDLYMNIKNIVERYDKF
tara:strand:- start:295 stop:1086 length:792 start_codon:yes stop_codon:yes gene_type:complete